MEDIRYKILIDGRFIGVGESISRYTLEILKGILALDKKNQYTLLVRPQGEKIAEQFIKIANPKSKDRHCEESRSLNSSGQARQSDVRVILSDPDLSGESKDLDNLTIEVLDVKHYSLSEQTKLLKWLNEKKFDLVHFTQFNHPINYKGKFVATVHDLTLLGHLYRMNFVRRLGFRAVMSSVIKNSTAIITDSKTSKEDVVKTYKADEKKISVINLGVDEKFNSKVKSQKSKIGNFRKKYRILGDYILYTGMWKRHKNLLRMLKAFEQVQFQISNFKCQMILVGKIDKDEPEVISEINRINFKIAKLLNCQTAPNSSNNLTIQQFNNSPIVATGFIDEAELPLAYAGALAYCIPSLSEGFGLPPLEAMACGTPVISSNISAMPEILGNAPLYFDPYDVDDIASAMKKIVSDEKLQKELSQKGLKQAKRYNWQNTAEKTLDIYKKVLTNN